MEHEWVAGGTIFAIDGEGYITMDGEDPPRFDSTLIDHLGQEILRLAGEKRQLRESLSACRNRLHVALGAVDKALASNET